MKELELKNVKCSGMSAERMSGGSLLQAPLLRYKREFPSSYTLLEGPCEITWNMTKPYNHYLVNCNFCLQSQKRKVSIGIKHRELP